MFVARPGPRKAVDPGVIDALHAALLKNRIVMFDYASGATDVATLRQVMPLGLLSGLRRYLVLLPDQVGARERSYRLDKIAAFEVSADWFEQPEGFDLSAFARRGFGASRRTTSMNAPPESPPAAASNFRPYPMRRAN